MNDITITSLHEVAKNNNKVNLVVVVLQTTAVRNVTIKHGVDAGSIVDLASVLVGDQSEFYVTISFWGDQAKWVDKLYTGDIVVFTNLAFTVNKNRKVGKATEASSLCNFKNPGHECANFKGELFFSKTYILQMMLFILAFEINSLKADVEDLIFILISTITHLRHFGEKVFFSFNTVCKKSAVLPPFMFDIS